jgi:hypothetical protein
VKAFDLERQNDDYFVWVRTPTQAEKPLPLESEKEEFTASAAGTYQLRYSPKDVDRLEREGRARRRNPNGMPDLYSMSQLLGALGAYIIRRNARLLAISWREESVNVVYQTLKDGENWITSGWIPSMIFGYRYT